MQYPDISLIFPDGHPALNNCQKRIRIRFKIQCSREKSMDRKKPGEYDGERKKENDEKENILSMERKNAWSMYDEKQLEQLEKVSEEYRRFLSEAKTERECAALVVKMAEKKGYRSLEKLLEEGKTLQAGDKLIAHDSRLVNRHLNHTGVQCLRIEPEISQTVYHGHALNHTDGLQAVGMIPDHQIRPRRNQLRRLL